jgi:hypothetical protein
MPKAGKNHPSFHGSGTFDADLIVFKMHLRSKKVKCIPGIADYAEVLKKFISQIKYTSSDRLLNAALIILKCICVICVLVGE